VHGGPIRVGERGLPDLATQHRWPDLAQPKTVLGRPTGHGVPTWPERCEGAPGRGDDTHGA
jgi:hypothetical protein